MLCFLGNGDQWKWVGYRRSFLLTAKSFLFTVGLCCLRSIGLIFLTYCRNSVWYFLLTVPPVSESEVNKRGRPSKWPPECLPSKVTDFECAFSLIPWRKYDSQRPLFWRGLSGTNSGGPFAAGRFCFHAQPDDRGTGQWKWMEEVPRRTSLVPLAFPCFLLCLRGVETEGLLDYQGWAGDHLHCTVETSPGHIRSRFSASGSPHLEIWSFFKNETSAQRGSFWDRHPEDIRGSFARISRPKTSVRAVEILENKHLGADIHDPKARTSTTLRDFQKRRSEKLWAGFSFPIFFKGRIKGLCGRCKGSACSETKIARVRRRITANSGNS